MQVEFFSPGKKKGGGGDYYSTHSKYNLKLKENVALKKLNIYFL